jgi:hypothetical protein
MEVLEGGCHCGAVRFRVDVAEFAATDCNCSMCTKKGMLHLIVAPERFELLKGSDALTTYTFNTGVAQHRFCRTCGVHPFYTPRSHPDKIDVNIRCLDGDAWRRFAITPFDGQNWERHVAELG